MAIDFNPTISSPGVEIREWDLSNVALPSAGTNVFITGFAQQGYIDEVIKITTKQELDQVYGIPTNSAERYFYHTAKEILNSPANLYTIRIPYGAGSGDGFGSQYSALVYSASAFPSQAISGSGTYSTITSGGIVALGEPCLVELTEAEFLSAKDNTLWEWQDVGGLGPDAVDDAAVGAARWTAIGKSPLVILNKSLTTTNQNSEGYYIGIKDNVDMDPSSNFVGIGHTKTVTASANVTDGTNYDTLLNSRLSFPLTAAASSGPWQSISEIMENLTRYDLNGRTNDDILSIGVFKLRESQNASEASKLSYILEDKIVGSINAWRKIDNPAGGDSINYSLENQDNNSRNVVIKVNEYVSSRLDGDNGLDSNGNPKMKIRVAGPSLRGTNVTDAERGFGVSKAHALTGFPKNANSLYPFGPYVDYAVTTKDLGDIPTKLDRALDAVKNDEIYDIDIVAEAGLGTIWTMASAAYRKRENLGVDIFYDEFYYSGEVSAGVEALRTGGAIAGEGLKMRNIYNTIFDKFETFVKPPFLGGTRGDAIFIADSFRQIYAIGEGSTRVLDNKSRNFQTDIFWPTKHQFESQNTSYAAVYGNWAQTYDSGLGQLVWVPFSGYAAAVMAKSDAATWPWYAPAGFNRGLLTTATDIAVNPNQKQRDELYKSSINPVAFFPSQGNVIFGQKTLNKKPSAFDRINVRRLFLALERPTKKAAKFFVFEPNTEFTRTRLVNVLRPIFERAKQNQGVYDYLIVCDERNNTPQIIDENKLRVDIYLKPVRTAEFILITFYATRTDANFQEITDGPALLYEGSPVS